MIGKKGEFVSYDMGVIKGTGIVIGKSHDGPPPLGTAWIIRRKKDNIEKGTYDFTCLAVHECFITAMLMPVVV